MIRKSLYAFLALAVVLAFSPLPSLQAASLVGPGTKVQADSPIDQVAKKKKKAAKSSKAGNCGTYMYYAKGKCVDTRVTPPKK